MIKAVFPARRQCNQGFPLSKLQRSRLLYIYIPTRPAFKIPRCACFQDTASCVLPFLLQSIRIAPESFQSYLPVRRFSNMMPSILKRPALGQIAALGSLYDARSDTFISLSLLKEAPPATSVETTQKHSTDIKFSRTDTYKEKFDRLEVEAALSASFLAGLVKVEARVTT